MEGELQHCNQNVFFYSRFARLAAAAFLNNGIPVYLLGKIVPTPFVPFTILQYGAAAGVMVTASHNPKEDNGYKVYWENGAQVSSWPLLPLCHPKKRLVIFKKNNPIYDFSEQLTVISIFMHCHPILLWGLFMI